MYKTIVIDDEKLSRELLIDILKKFKEIDIINEASDGEEAVKKIEKLNPDLIFLDIQMPKMNGFEVLEKLKEKGNDPLVIFTTAFDEYALKAFDTHSIDYILKPYNEKKLEKAIGKLSVISDKVKKVTELESTISKFSNKILKRISVKEGSDIVFVDLKDIYYLKSEHKYVTIYTYDDEFLISDTLTDLEKKLPDNFIRVHRSYIINNDQLKKLKRWFRNQYKAVMKDKKETEIPVNNEAKVKYFV